MSITVHKKELLQKYAKLLHYEERSPKSPKTKPRPKILHTTPSMNSPTSSHSLNQSGTLEKFIALRQAKPTTSHQLPQRTFSQPAVFKAASSRLDSPHFTLDSPITTSSPKYLPTSSDYLLTATEESYRQRDDPLRLTKSSMGNYHLPTSFKSPHDAKKTLSIKKLNITAQQTPNKSSARSPAAYPEISSFRKADLTLDEFFNEAKGFNHELKAMISEDHEPTLKLLMKHLRVKDFIHVQKKRFTNVHKVLEKALIDNNSNSKPPKETKLRQDIWQLVQTELNRIRTVYDEFLHIFEENLDKVTQAKSKAEVQLKPWEALLFVVQQSSVTREEALTGKKEYENPIHSPAQKIYDFKLDYKVSKNFSPRILEIYEFIESYIKESDQAIIDEREKLRTVLHHQEGMLQKYDDHAKEQSTAREDIVLLIQDMKRANLRLPEPDRAQITNSFLKKSMDDLQDENLKMFKEMQAMKAELKELRLENRRLNQQNEKTANKFVDKAIMVDAYGDTSKSLQPLSLFRIISEPQSVVITSHLSKDLVFAVMNLILTDKMIIDQCDDFEKRPRLPLNIFVADWFAKRFGIYEYTETIIQEFMSTLQTLSEPRYKLFLALIGNKEELQPEDSNAERTGEQIGEAERTELRRNCYQTPEILNIFYKIISHIKTVCSQLQISKFFSGNNYGPYLLNFEPRQEQMSYHVAKKVIDIVVKEEGFTFEEVRSLEEHLDLLIQRNMMHARLRFNTHSLDDEEVTDIQNIEFDVFIKFLLDAIVDKRMRLLDKYFTAFKTHIVSQKYSHISYDEFCTSVTKLNPDASQAWKDHAFGNLMRDDVAKSVPLSSIVNRFVSSFFKTTEVKDFGGKGKSENYIDSVEMAPAKGRNKSKKNTTLSTGKQRGSLQNSSQFSQAQISQAQPPGHSHARHPSLTINPKQRLLVSNKEGMTLGSPILNEIGYDLYDSISSLIVLQEAYALVEEALRVAEKGNDSLSVLHENFIKDMSSLPQNVVNMPALDVFLVYSKEELVDYLEGLWAKFRVLLVSVFRSK